MKRFVRSVLAVIAIALVIVLASWGGSPARSVVASSPNKLAALGTAEMSAARKQQIVASYGQMPLSFEANRGQTNAQVRFISRGSGYTLFLTGNEAVLALRKASPGPKVESPTGESRNSELETRHSPHSLDASRGARPSTLKNPQSEINSRAAVLRFKLMGANPSPPVAGMEELAGKSNYFHGNDRTQWCTNVPTYARVKYQGVYPGIDLVYHGNQRQLEYDFVVAPGAHPQAIRLSLRGAESMEIDGQGDLVLHTAAGEVREHKPVVYQEIAGSRQAIAGSYVLRGKAEVGFAVAPYDTGQPLVIDPVLSYSTYLGGSSDDAGWGIAVDAAGNAYLTGSAGSGFPTTPGAFQTAGSGFGDAFVTKLNPDGSALIYSTYLGGNRADVGYSIAVDAAGNAYLTGSAGSGFPTTPGAFQTTFGGSGFSGDAFVTKLNTDGSALIYSTYLGGSQTDSGNGIAVDAAGNAYLTGNTSSTNFPTTPGAFQPTNGGGFPGDAFVTKLNASGSALIYSTYLGGSDTDVGSGIAVDSAGSAYLTGYAFSTDFPTTPGAFQTALSGGVNDDAFVTKLNASGSALIYSTYLGGSDHDGGFSITVDAAGNAYLAGFTISGNFPTTTGAFQTTFAGGGDDVFVTKLNKGGSALIYSTYLGGSADDAGYGIAVDSASNAYLTGPTSSTNFPTTPDAFQTTFGGGKSDAFVTELNASGSALLSSTYLGGSDNDFGSGIAVDTMDNAYLTGTAGSGFPTTTSALQTTFGGGSSDAFIARVAADFSLSASALSPDTVNPGGSSTSTIDLTAAPGFTDPVTLSCSVQPSPAPAPKCSISPGSITPGTSALLTVTTTAPTSGALPSWPGSGPLYALCLPLIGLVGAGAGFGREHKRMGELSAVALTCVLFAGLVFLAACAGGSSSGGGGGGGGGNSGTPAGTYTITVTGTSGSLVHSTNTTLTVQ